MVATVDDAGLPEVDEGVHREMPDGGDLDGADAAHPVRWAALVKQVASLARDYATAPGERLRAALLLSGILLVNVGTVASSVLVSFSYSQVFTALGDRDLSGFLRGMLLVRFTAGGWPMPGYVWLVAVFVPLAMYGIYLKGLLELNWRRWLTHDTVELWLAHRRHLRLSQAGGVGSDNPDQRIQEDIPAIAHQTVDLGVGFFSNLLSLASFLGILWSLSASLKVFGHDVPGLLVWSALAYAAIGTLITNRVGRPLATLNRTQQRLEADFRYSLVRIREDGERIALLDGEPYEAGVLDRRFSAVVANYERIVRRRKILTGVTAGYSQVSALVGMVIGAPQYFAGTLSLGAFQQLGGAFGQVQSSLSWFIERYGDLALWHSEVARLIALRRRLALLPVASDQPRRVSGGPPLEISGITVTRPDGTRIVDRVSFAVKAGGIAAIAGPSGSGKSTLLRALAGVWPTSSGEIRVSAKRSLHLGQAPYLPSGTLRDAICYPDAAADHPAHVVSEALATVGLARLLDRLDEAAEWSRNLSPGERQLVALARALVLRPSLLLLDEPTASLDGESEALFDHVLRTRFGDAAVLAVSHREPFIANADQVVRTGPRAG